MAVDRWLWQSSDRPCLRFYTWSPPAISLGYSQRQIPEHWQHLHWQGQPIELVQRPTGAGCFAPRGSHLQSSGVGVGATAATGLYRSVSIPEGRV